MQTVRISKKSNKNSKIYKKQTAKLCKYKVVFYKYKYSLSFYNQDMVWDSSKFPATNKREEGEDNYV